MLKHATITRTSRVQQELHEQWNKQMQLTSSSTNQSSCDGLLTKLDSSESTANNNNNINIINNNNNIVDLSDIATGSVGPSPNWFLDNLMTSRGAGQLQSTGSRNPSPSPSATPTKRVAISSAPSSVFSSPTKTWPGGLSSDNTLPAGYRLNDNTAKATSDANNTQTIVSSLTSTSTSPSSRCSSESMIKIFAQTLSQEVEYVTLHVNAQTKSSQIIRSLLRKFRLKNRDPNLFYLTLERWIRKDGLRVKSVMLLGDEACPLQLQQCCSNPPHNDIKFTLQMRTGALIKIHCSDVCPNTRYKCLSLSTQTTVDETIELMLHCITLISGGAAHRRPEQTTSINNNNSYIHHHQSTTSHPRVITNPRHQFSAADDDDDNHHHHHHHETLTRPCLVSGSPSPIPDSSSTSSGASSSSSSSSSSASSCSPSAISSSSGIDSDPMVASQAHQQHQQQPYTDRLLDANSRCNSVTSISSSSNTSNSSGSQMCDQYCLVIECRDTNYRRILEPEEHLVDVYQGLVDEAREKDHQLIVSKCSLNNKDCSLTDDIQRAKSPNSFHLQQPDQWFMIKLKRRDDVIHQSIRVTNPRQNMPLPPIPLSLAQMNNNDHLQKIVSTTQIEVGNQSRSLHQQLQLQQRTHPRHLSSLATPMATSESCPPVRSNTRAADTVDGHFPPPRASTMTSPTAVSNNNGSNNAGQPPVHFRQMSAIVAAGHPLVHHSKRTTGGHISTSSTPDMPPPPASLIWLPPIRPRRRNLSKASTSTFGPVQSSATTSSNKRRYDPAQLAQDLDRLGMSDKLSSMDEEQLQQARPGQATSIPPNGPQSHETTRAADENNSESDNNQSTTTTTTTAEPPGAQVREEEQEAG